MNIRPFEIVLIAFFSIAAIVGLFYVSNLEADPAQEEKIYGDSVSIWGTLDERIMNDFLVNLTQGNRALLAVKYTQIDVRTFDTTLLSAIAEGKSPDLIIVPNSLLVSYRAKLQPISYEVFPERNFKDTYIDGAEVFTLNDGIYGIPFAVNPLVLYWNRDIFSSSGLSEPPKTWETLVAETTKAIVRGDSNLNISQSAVAFGEYVNVVHAKDILAMLFMQAGSNLVTEGDTGYVVNLNKENSGSGLSAGDAVLSFYTQFAIPGRDLYSWNRSKGLDRAEFLNGTLAMYFGKGSEKKALERENPNLNFDAAPVPQGSGATVKRNYGDFYAFSIPRAAKNPNGAYGVALLLGNPVNAKSLYEAFGFAPVHRALYPGNTGDPFRSVLNQSGLIARGWLDPSPGRSGQVFQGMIEEVTSGRSRLENVILDAGRRLEALF